MALLDPNLKNHINCNFTFYRFFWMNNSGILGYTCHSANFGVVSFFNLSSNMTTDMSSKTVTNSMNLFRILIQIIYQNIYHQFFSNKFAHCFCIFSSHIIVGILSHFMPVNSNDVELCLVFIHVYIWLRDHLYIM